MVRTKKELGQFFTTNVDYILQGFENLVKNKNVLDPFVGNGDLLKWAEKHKAKNLNGYDIDKQLIIDLVLKFKGHFKENDSLLNIPNAQFNLTNPPYLAKNKMSKQQKSKYLKELDDFYLLAIRNIINSKTEEGIVIIPVNFFSAENSDKVRVELLSKYNITKVNYFKEQVFDDTTYNVVSFHYFKKEIPSIKQVIEFTFYPEKKSKSFILEEKYSYRIAGKEIAEIMKSPKLKIIRLTEKQVINNSGKKEINCLFNDKNTEKKYFVNEKLSKNIKNNILLLNCIDSNTSESGRIKIEDVQSFGYDCLIGKLTSRNIAYVLLSNEVSIHMQKQIIFLFNQVIQQLRNDFNSLFLTNFRDNDRKRISFDFCYQLISYCYEKLN